MDNWQMLFPNKIKGKQVINFKCEEEGITDMTHKIIIYNASKWWVMKDMTNINEMDKWQMSNYLYLKR